MIGQVQQASGVVSLSADTLIPAANEIKARASNLGADVLELQDATEESSSAITTVASAVEQITVVVASVADAASETGASMPCKFMNLRRLDRRRFG